MKRRSAIILIAVTAVPLLLILGGIGPYRSNSAIADLTEQLTQLHGEPYTGRTVDDRIEDMEFVVEPDSFFLTKYGFRQLFGWDYRYECQVIYTVYEDGQPAEQRTVTYLGYDPMGSGEDYDRAYIDVESMETHTALPG